MPTYLIITQQNEVDKCINKPLDLSGDRLLESNYKWDYIPLTESTSGDRLLENNYRRDNIPLTENTSSNKTWNSCDLWFNIYHTYPES